MNNNSIIFKIIKKYIDELSFKLSTVAKDSIGFEDSLTTITNLVGEEPHDFFKGEKGALKNFGNPTILFNDLKKSTDLIKELEDKNILYYYSYYMYYSSKMLSEILDAFDAKIVECTGDGHYSILQNMDNLVADKIKREYSYFCEFLCETEKFENYLNAFDHKENSFIDNRSHLLDVDKIIRKLFFYIFAYFNIEINKLLPKGMSKKFLMRVGCATGECQIMRIENSHIRQDKLIGSVVHKSAHQASGKI